MAFADPALYPAARLKRTGPAPSGGGAVAKAALSVPRMRIFSLARDAHANIYNVMISPKCQGPAIILDVNVAAPSAAQAFAKGIKIFVADDDGGGVVSTATVQTPSGTPIFEDLLFKYSGAPPSPSPFLHGYQQLHTAVGHRHQGVVIPLEYPVYKSEFYVKVYVIGENQALEGSLRVLEGVDPALFF